MAPMHESAAQTLEPDWAPKIEFLLCGSPNDAFYSQTAMFRLALDSLGGIYRQARLVLCLGDHQPVSVPARWRQALRRVDVLWAPREMFLDMGDGGDFRYDVLDASCDLSLLCDADTLLLRPIEPLELRRMIEQPAVRGVIAHGPPRLTDQDGRNRGALGIPAFWNQLAQEVLGRPSMALPHQHTLTPQPVSCPFYINYGVVLGNFEMLRALYTQMKWIQPKVRGFLNNWFFAQLALPLGCLAADLPTEVLPMRYNFPNDPLADVMHEQELGQVVFMHYLRTKVFDRHQIFASAEAFNQFMLPDFSGSNLVFQSRVREITGGIYPFA